MAIQITEEAAAQVKRFKEEQQFSDDAFLRIGVTSGGCSGLSYSLAFDDNFDGSKDTRYDQHGVSVVVDKKSSIFLDGTKVDWHSSLDRQGFTFENPNVVKSCGCGSSFNA